MSTSKELISSWTKWYIKAEPYKNISTLKKQFFRTNLLKAIEFLGAFTYAKVFYYGERTFYDFKKKQLLQVNYIYYLKFKNGFIMYLEDP